VGRRRVAAGRHQGAADCRRWAVDWRQGARLGRAWNLGAEACQRAHGLHLPPSLFFLLFTGAGGAERKAWHMEGLEKLAKEISALLVHTGDERERERN
jgi:hypothetical protein